MEGVIGRRARSASRVRPPLPPAWCLAPRRGCAPPVSPAAARPGRGARTNPGGPLPAARSLLLCARQLGGASPSTLCYSDRRQHHTPTREPPNRPGGLHDTLGAQRGALSPFTHIRRWSIPGSTAVLSTPHAVLARWACQNICVYIYAPSKMPSTATLTGRAGHPCAVVEYRGTSLIRNSVSLGPYGRRMPMVLGRSQGGGQCLMSEVPLAVQSTHHAVLARWAGRSASRYPHGGVRPFRQKSTCLTQLTSGPYVVPVWSRNTPGSVVNETCVLHRVDGCPPRGPADRGSQVSYLTESVYRVVFQNPIPAQTRQRIRHYYS